MSGCSVRLGVQGPQRRGQPADHAVPGPGPPAVPDLLRPPVVLGLGPLTAGREPEVLAPAARRVRPAHHKPRFFQPARGHADRFPGHPGRRGCPPVRHPPALRTRSMLALTGRGTADPGSNSARKLISAREKGGQLRAGPRGAPATRPAARAWLVCGRRRPAGRRPLVAVRPPTARSASLARRHGLAGPVPPRSSITRPAAPDLLGPAAPPGGPDDASWRGGDARLSPGPARPARTPERSRPARLISGTRSATSRSGTPSVGRNRRKLPTWPATPATARGRMSRRAPGRPVRELTLRFVVELDRERDESLRQQRRKPKLRNEDRRPAETRRLGFPGWRGGGRRAAAARHRRVPGRVGRGTTQTVSARPRPRLARVGPARVGPARAGMVGGRVTVAGIQGGPDGAAPRAGRRLRRRACRAPDVQAGGGRARAAPRAGP